MDSDTPAPLLKDARSYRPFKSSEDYLFAMKEDLAEWLNMLYTELYLSVDNFMDKLETGVVLCNHANEVFKSAVQFMAKYESRTPRRPSPASQYAPVLVEMGELKYRCHAKPGTFFARDNVSNFISWCRVGLGVMECLLFETDDLCLRKNEKHVILCLLEVARRGSRLGMPAPMLVQLEREIDREQAAEQRSLAPDKLCDEYSDEDELPVRPVPQIVTNDLKSLDEMVRDLLEHCRCPVQFPMIRVAEGKYRIGDSKLLIYVRVLRVHVMVRVGGGWDTLAHYLDKHDPCRCKTGHRTPVAAKLVTKSGAPYVDLASSSVFYERSPPRTRRSSASSVGSGGGGCLCGVGGTCLLYPAHAHRIPSRSRSPTPSCPATPTRSPTSSRPTTPTIFSRASPLKCTTVRPSTQTSIQDSSPHICGDSTSDTLDHWSSPRLQPSTQSTGGENSSDGLSRAEDSVMAPGSNGDINSILSRNLLTPRDLLYAENVHVPEGFNVNGLAHMSKNCITQFPDSNRSRRQSHSPRRVTTKMLSRSASSSETNLPEKFSGRGASLSHKKNFSDKAGKLNDNGREQSYQAARVSGKQGGTNNTWSGRQGRLRNRPSLTTDTYVSNRNGGIGSRNSFQRNSFGSYGSSHASPRSYGARHTKKSSLPSSLQSSPTKQISPLLEQILQVGDLSNDTILLNKMKEIIHHYSDVVDDKLEENKSCEIAETVPTGDESLDFTLEWVRGNGSLEGIKQHKTDCSSDPGDLGHSDSFDPANVKAGPSPRRDLKTEGSASRIPAPTFYRPHSTAEQPSL